MAQGFDIAAEITQAIITRLDAGTKPWERPWTGLPLCRPLRSCGTAYRGINILLLWMRAEAQSYSAPWWFSYKQAALIGGQVRKGEKATHCVYYKQLNGSENGDDDTADTQDGDQVSQKRGGRVLRSFAVFNADQIDGLPSRYAPPIKTDEQPLYHDAERLRALLDAIPVTTLHSGATAFYRPSTDVITLPHPDDFRDYPSYAATRLHESAHATGHRSRLARDFGGRFGGNAYAFEELVAEIASAMVGAALGLPATLLDNHASYVASWLTVLKNDRNAILTAAARAQDASDMILGWLSEEMTLANPHTSPEPLELAA
jgi:antirestriction protein ArdC